jgi:hypothetical protein
VNDLTGTISASVRLPKRLRYFRFVELVGNLEHPTLELVASPSEWKRPRSRLSVSPRPTASSIWPSSARSRCARTAIGSFCAAMRERHIAPIVSTSRGYESSEKDAHRKRSPRARRGILMTIPPSVSRGGVPWRIALLAEHGRHGVMPILPLSEVDEPIVIKEYDAAWPRVFADERARVLDELGHAVANIEHFGSTAVLGMMGKPVVDLLRGPLLPPPSWRVRFQRGSDGGARRILVDPTSR